MSKPISKGVTPAKGKSSVLDQKVNQYEESMKKKFIDVMSEPGIKYADCLDYIQNEIDQSKKMAKFRYRIPCFKNDGIYQLNQAISEVFGSVVPRRTTARLEILTSPLWTSLLPMALG